MDKAKTELGWFDFLEMCTTLKTPEEYDKFFKLFLTIEERHDIADRYRIVRELLKGEKTQREIAESLGVSIAKITRGSNSLKIIDDELETFLKEKISGVNHVE